jgi:hypothetical protein
LSAASDVRGVYPSRGRWRAQVVHNGKVFRVGTFGTIAEAEAAVIAKRNELYGHNDRP